MSDAHEVVVVAEGRPDAEVVKQLTCLIITRDHSWIADHVDTFGQLDDVLRFRGDPASTFLSWGRVKSLAAAKNIRILRLGVGPFCAETRKALAVANALAPLATVAVHRDQETVGSEGPTMRELCASHGAIFALPNPATEAWLLLAAGHPVPTTVAEAKGAVGRTGVTLQQLTVECLGRLALAPDAHAFVEDVRRILIPRIRRTAP